MKTLLNLLLLVALGVLTFGVWAGKQQSPDPYLEQIRSRGVLRVGIDPTYPPFDVVSDGQIGGYDAELARALASDLGVQVEFVPLALDTMYDALAADKVDVLISALPFVYERQAEVRYSVPYYQAGQVLVVRAGEAAIASVRDLAGRTIGVELGSNADTEARRIARTSVPTMQLRSVYTTPEEALEALRKGEIDAVVTDSLSAQQYLREHNETVRLLSPSITDEPYVVAMPQSATSLSANIDASIERLRASGELGRIMGLVSK